ncbi:hypothetical protein Q5P01_000148 [Channa striata]|uniref:Immunoglobulin V-set domain-containing protein n=1 Tax=Channa striata TaxID=64152 RepID=A0AA88IS66_CHASR|nr:hypothetical protein Q5P01_000148 [Channa striata]
MSVCAAGLLLMMTAIFCPAVGQTPFSLSVSQDVYQAEQHSNITLTWTFPVSAVSSSDSLVVDIKNVGQMRRVYNYDRKTETGLSPHEHYRGRVLCDPVLITKGRIECVFTDLRLNDTGTYQCIVTVVHRYTDDKTCDLNVTAALDRPAVETSNPESRKG